MLTMAWIVLSVCSAVFLGVYDLTKKASVKGNAVAPVLLLSCIVGAFIWLPFVIWSRASPEFASNEFLYVDNLRLDLHPYLFAKSLLVGASWTFAFFALKHLPITIAAPTISAISARCERSFMARSCWQSGVE